MYFPQNEIYKMGLAHAPYFSNLYLYIYKREREKKKKKKKRKRGRGRGMEEKRRETLNSIPLI
jgi:hypothetical protein